MKIEVRIFDNDGHGWWQNISSKLINSENINNFFDYIEAYDPDKVVDLIAWLDEQTKANFDIADCHRKQGWPGYHNADCREAKARAFIETKEYIEESHKNLCHKTILKTNEEKTEKSETCGVMSRLDHVCQKPKGHDGLHHNYTNGVTWAVNQESPKVEIVPCKYCEKPIHWDAQKQLWLHKGDYLYCGTGGQINYPMRSAQPNEPLDFGLTEDDKAGVKENEHKAMLGGISAKEAQENLKTKLDAMYAKEDSTIPKILIKKHL